MEAFESVFAPTLRDFCRVEAFERRLVLQPFGIFEGWKLLKAFLLPLAHGMGQQSHLGLNFKFEI